MGRPGRGTRRRRSPARRRRPRRRPGRSCALVQAGSPPSTSTRWYRPTRPKASFFVELVLTTRGAGPYIGAMKLGVEAALVDGILVQGDVEVLDGLVVGYGLASRNGRGIAAPGFVDLQVNGFGGVDFLDADTAAYARAGEALLETGVTAYLPTLITSPEDQILAAMREVPLGESRPRILGMHLEGPFLSSEPPRHARGLGPARSRPGAARAAARRRPGAADDARAGAPGRGRADRPAARARRRRVARPHRRDRSAGQRGLRPRRAERHPSVQRHAAVPASRPGHRRRGARARRRDRLDHPRRHSPRARDDDGRVARRGRAAGARHRRDRRHSGRRRRALRASASSTCRCTRARCAGPTASSPAAC